MEHTSIAYPQSSQDDFFSTRGSIRGGSQNRGMFELGETVGLLLGRRLCHSAVYSDELAYVTSKVRGSGTKTRVNTRLPGNLFGGFVYNFIIS